MFGFKSLIAMAAVLSAVAGGLVAYVYEDDGDSSVAQASASDSSGEDAGFAIPDEIRQRLPEGFQIPPDIEATLQQRFEHGQIPGGAGFFANPDGSFDFSAAPGGFGGQPGQFGPGDGN